MSSEAGQVEHAAQLPDGAHQMVGRHEPFDVDRGIGELVAIGLSQLQLVNGHGLRGLARRCSSSTKTCCSPI